MTLTPELEANLRNAINPRIASMPDTKSHTISVLLGEIDRLRELLKKSIQSCDNEEGMAECMRMFRSDMIEAGVIDSSVPPMFMTEGVMREIDRLRAMIPQERSLSMCVSSQYAKGWNDCVKSMLPAAPKTEDV